MRMQHKLGFLVSQLLKKSQHPGRTDNGEAGNVANWQNLCVKGYVFPGNFENGLYAK
jgi:hypothetical protein